MGEGKGIEFYSVRANKNGIRIWKRIMVMWFGLMDAQQNVRNSKIKIMEVNFISVGDIDVVDLESAKRIKSEGFDKPTYWYWMDGELTFVEKGLKRVKMGKRRMNHNKYDEWIYSAPTKDEFFNWLKK